MFRWLVSQRLKFKTERGKFIRLCGEFRRLDDTKRRKKKRTTNNIVSGNARNWLNFQLNVSNRYWNFDSAWVEMFVWTLTNLSLLYLVVALSDYQIGRPLLLARLNTCFVRRKKLLRLLPRVRKKTRRIFTAAHFSPTESVSSKKGDISEQSLTSHNDNSSLFRLKKISLCLSALP